MADKTIGELPVAEELYDDSLLVVEQQREARSIRGELVAEFAREAAAADVQRAVDAAASAEKSAGAAKTDADRAEEMRQSIELDYTYIDTARSEAQASAQAAEDSAQNAKGSEDTVRASQEAAKASEEAAKASQDAAKESETAAKSAAETAKTSQEEAAVSESAAAAYASSAKDSETSAGASASAAAKSAADGSEYATAAQSYAVGDTGSREGEEADNAKYYYDQAKLISKGLAGALLPMGTITFDELQTQSQQAGYMYNISGDFTTDGTFREGEGHAYPAGTNVYWTAEGDWDCLAGAQVVSVNGETGAVTITPEKIGAPNVTDSDLDWGIIGGNTPNGNSVSIAFNKEAHCIYAAARDSEGRQQWDSPLYSPEFPPPYPVKSVNGATGDVKLNFIIEGGGTGMEPPANHGISIGWSSNGLLAQVDSTSLGKFVFETDAGASGLWEHMKKKVLDSVYPVGSYYWSNNNVSPGSTLGGSWTQVQDAFVLAAGKTYGVSTAVKGAASHTLTKNELPSYNLPTPNINGMDVQLATGNNANTIGLLYEQGRGGGPLTYMLSSGGGGQAFSTMPPYVVAYCWRRTA